MSELRENIETEIKKKMENLGALNPDKLEKSLNSLKVEATEFIRKYPLSSAAAVLALGFFIGRISSRK
jgi:ElaB/YqjD/DUF883 family membrane-anchored ribosome-binding protein